MKYTIIICLLFAIINSREDFPNIFGIAKSFLGKTSIGSGITNVCEEVETKDLCLAIKNPLEKYQCCFQQTNYIGNINEKCDQFSTDIKQYEKIVKTDQFKAFSSETMAFSLLNFGFPLAKTDIKINCNNGEINMALLEKNYTENELNTLKDKNHCLQKKASKKGDYEYDVEKCEEGLIVDSSKKAGLECGYFVYNIKINQNESFTYKTCDLFNFNMLSSMTKINPQFAISDVENIISNSKEYDSYESFTAEVYNAKGQKIKFDSTSEKIVYESGLMFTFSKYLILLILIVF